MCSEHTLATHNFKGDTHIHYIICVCFVCIKKKTPRYTRYYQRYIKKPTQYMKKPTKII